MRTPILSDLFAFFRFFFFFELGAVVERGDSMYLTSLSIVGSSASLPLTLTLTISACEFYFKMKNNKVVAFTYIPIFEKGVDIAFDRVEINPGNIH